MHLFNENFVLSNRLLSKLLIGFMLSFVFQEPMNGYIHTTVLQGNVTIAGLFEIRSSKNGAFGDVDVMSVMRVEAVRWYLQSAMAKGTLPFTIGLDVYETCGSTAMAADSAVDIVHRSRSGSSVIDMQDFIVGVLGPETSPEAQVVSSIIGSQSVSNQLLQIAFSATFQELNNREKYPNFYRVCPDDDVQIQTMVKLMLRLQWNRIAILYTNDTYGRVRATELQSLASDHHICVSKIDAITIDANGTINSGQIRNILVKYMVQSQQIEGVIYFGVKFVANQVFAILEHLSYNNIPIFILSESIQLQTDVFYSAPSSVFQKSKGSLVVSIPYREHKEFAEYWRGLFTNITLIREAAVGNPYLNDVFRKYTDCNLTTTECPAMSVERITELSSPQPVYVSYAILTAYTLVQAITKTYNTGCRGASCSTLDEFRENFYPNKLFRSMSGLNVSYNGVSLAFSSSPNPVLTDDSTEYEVYNFRSDVNNTSAFGFVKVGQLSHDDVFLDTMMIRDYIPADGTEMKYPDIRRGQCPIQNVCTECVDPDVTKISYHIPGDFYVIGIFSINNRAIPGPQGCGSVRFRNGYQLFLALEFSLHEFKTRTWYRDFRENFGGKTIGAIVINSCNNPLEVVQKVIELHSKGLRLPDGTIIDLTNRILGYVGGQAGEVSQPVASQLTILKFVQISHSTTNPDLSNKQMYPYFMRIITADSVQARATIDIVKKLKGKYIQIVYNEGGYGEGAFDALKNEASLANICIAQATMVEESSSYFKYYEILKRKPHAKVVVVFLRSHVLRPFLRDLDKDMTRGEFHFIGSEAWGLDKEILQYEISKGSLVVSVEMDKNMDLEEYIKSQKPQFNETNPWLEEYIQNRQNCYFDWSFNKNFPKKCTDDILPQNDPHFESDPWCIFVFNTMIALLKGSSIYFASKCGSGVTTLCTDYVDNPEGLFQELTKMKMNIYGTGDILIFDNNGDGLMGYKIYNIKVRPEDKTSRIYSQVGSYNPGRGLDLETDNLEYPTDDLIVSECPSESACNSCKDVHTTVPAKDDGHVAIAVLSVLVGVLAIVATLLVVFIVLLKRKRKENQDAMYLTPTADMTMTERPATEGSQHSGSRGYTEGSQHSGSGGYVEPKTIYNVGDRTVFMHS